ncbi:hypothetical protein A2706_02260 [Candidatus Peribacteria bacterium RIFCSPHIGHO2_01_FULL_51_35]|nr:MAG: hypothetical protein A2706_02260 [Candidatus Peribacteria bacterium RIFCSPHIGHO2_01_FULL_51_35]
MGATSSPFEKGFSHSPEYHDATKHIVSQPLKSEVIRMLDTLNAIDSVPQRVSERTGEDISGDMGMAAGTAGAGQISPRDQAIANLPEPVLMQKQLEKHIQREVRRLTKEAARISRLQKPGAAFYLNELYARIRRLNALLHELWDASVEVVKRLFIRVFVDKQPIL